MNSQDAEEYTQSLGQIVAGSWRQVALAKRLGVPKALGLTVEQWVTDRLGGYVKMSIPEREEAVKNLTVDGYSTREQAEIIGVSHQTVANTVKNLTPGANASPAFAPLAVNRVTLNTGDNEWFTPAKYAELARRVLGEFDLDPASNDFAQQTIKAARYFTSETDGLKHEWSGRVWLNPPYAQPLIEDFINKLVAEHSAGKVAASILLVNNCTDATWFHTAANACSAICFTRGRIKFEKPDGVAGSPTQGQAFFYFGADIPQFREAFGEIGLIVIPSPNRDTPYDAADDFAKSIDVAYEAVRDRVADGGSTWTPKPLDEPDGIPDFLQRKRGAP